MRKGGENVTQCRGSNNSDFGYSGKLVELSRCDCDYIFVSCTLDIGSVRRWQDGSHGIPISSAPNSTSWQWRGRVTCQTDINIFQHNLPLFSTICPLLKCRIWLERFEETQSSKQWCHRHAARWQGGEGDNLHIVTIYSVIKQRQPAACAVQWCSVQRRPGAAALQWSRHLQQPRLLPGCSCCSNQAGRCCQARHCSSCSRGGGYKQPCTLVCTSYLHAINIYTLVCVRYLHHQQIQISSVFSKWVIHLRASHRLIEKGETNERSR